MEEVKEQNLGFGAAAAQYDMEKLNQSLNDSKMNSNRGGGGGNRGKNNQGSMRMLDDPGNGDWTTRVKRVGEDR